MTTATPISSNLPSAGSLSSTGLPDEALLARLANEFFRLLPGAADAAIVDYAEPRAIVILYGGDARRGRADCAATSAL